MNTDLLELYTDYLLSTFSHATATGLSKMTNGEVSHDKITRFLAEKDLDSPALWRFWSSRWCASSKGRRRAS